MCGAANAVTHSERVYPYPNLPYPVGSEYLINEIVTEIPRAPQDWYFALSCHLDRKVALESLAFVGTTEEPSPSASDIPHETSQCVVQYTSSQSLSD